MNRMFVFHGVDAKVGTTMISQSVSEMIADNNREIKVMMVSLSGRSGTEYVTRVGESIEAIKIYLDNRVLSKKELLKTCKRTENLYQLGGVDSIGESRHYFPEASSYFLETMKEEFDVIIVDSGNDLDNGLAVGALELINDRFLVLTQQESMIRRYEKIVPLYSRLNISFDRKILNKYSDSDPYSVGYIAERLGFNLREMIKVGAVSCGRQAEMDYRTLISYNNEIYNRDITDLSNIILTECCLEPIQFRRKKKWKAFI